MEDGERERKMIERERKKEEGERERREDEKRIENEEEKSFVLTASNLIRFVNAIKLTITMITSGNTLITSVAFKLVVPAGRS